MVRGSAVRGAMRRVKEAAAKAAKAVDRAVDSAVELPSPRQDDEEGGADGGSALNKSFGMASQAAKGFGNKLGNFLEEMDSMTELAAAGGTPTPTPCPISHAAILTSTCRGV